MTLECKCGHIFVSKTTPGIVIPECPECGASGASNLSVLRHGISTKENGKDGEIKFVNDPDWHKKAKLMDEIQVHLIEAWHLFCRLKGLVVPDPPGSKDPKAGG